MSPGYKPLKSRCAAGRRRWALSLLVIMGTFAQSEVAAGAAESGKFEALPFTAVTVDDAFWSPRQRVNREQTMPHLIAMCELEGRVRNLLRAGGQLDGPYEGTRAHDADLFKVIEAASYVLMTAPDPALQAKLDELIAAIAVGQQKDGYLHTATTVKDREDRSRKLLEYFADGHLIDAGLAHFKATGKTTLLSVARRSADLTCSLIGPGRRVEVPAHPKIESSLVQLYRVTGEKRYLELARFMIEERGHAASGGRKLLGVHGQDHLPVRDQRQAEGHVLCGLFLWTGALDLGLETADRTLVDVAHRVFADAVSRRMYVTGGMGRASDERFTEPYALDNDTSIGEGCQSAALIRLAQRLMLLEGDARYSNIIERVLYNNLAANVSLDGRSFYYVNRLSARPEDATGLPYRYPHTRTVKKLLPRFCLDRQPWFTVPCCPPNVAMALATLGEYIYAVSADAIAVNLFVGSRATVSVAGTKVTLEQKTGYPWTGNVALRVVSSQPAEFAMMIRIPDWCGELESTGGLYRPRNVIGVEKVELRVNGKSQKVGRLDRGYVRLHRRWQPGDTVELVLPMEILRVESHPAVEADRGRTALQRGPLVYCVEAVDHDGRIRDLVLPANATLRAELRPDLLNGVIAVYGNARHAAANGATEPKEMLAIPYGVWANRAVGEMDVWLAGESGGL